MSLHDADVVAAEYATEDGLVARASVYQGLAGPDARQIALDAVRRANPVLVLEVGCGWGEFAVRIASETVAKVRAIDTSPRMVELARERGVDAEVADVQALPFDDAVFDVVVANWMLYHVPDIDLALSELARVLRDGGALVAATNSTRHLEELWALVGRDRATEVRHFFSEDAEERLEPLFVAVHRYDIESTMTFNTESARGYVGSSVAHKHLASLVPELAEPLVATRRNTVFVATKRG